MLVPDFFWFQNFGKKFIDPKKNLVKKILNHEHTRQYNTEPNNTKPNQTGCRVVRRLFCQVPGFSTKICPKVVFGDFFNNVKYKSKQRLVS